MYYSISTRQYNRNRDEKRTGGLKFKTKQGTIEDLKDDVKNERAFCHCFNQKDVFGMHEKSQANFEAAYFIVLDLDAVRLTAGEFYGKTLGTDYTPSLVYTTCNDGIQKSDDEEYFNRYRVVYALDESITDAGVYSMVHDGLKSELGEWIGDKKNYFNDNTDSGADHMFAGCAGAEIYTTNNVTSTRVLIDKYVHGDNKVVQNGTGRSIIYREERGYYTTVGTKMDHPYRNFVNDFFDGKDYLTLQRDYYKDLPAMVTKKPYKYEKGKLYAKVDPDNDVYIVLKRVKVKKTAVSGNEIEVWEYYNWKDGQHRRRKLYMYLQQVKKATNATREQLLWQAVNWVVNCTDNTKDPITSLDIIKIIGQVMIRDWNPSEKSKKRYGRKIDVNTELAKKKNINPQRIGLEAANQARQDDKVKLWAEIAFLYDMKLTDKKNLSIMADAGLKVSQRQLKEWKEANGMTNKSKQYKINLIRENYDSTVSIAKNAEKIGLPVSTVKRLLKEIKAYPELDNTPIIVREAF